jgi:fatty acid desaturase
MPDNAAVAETEDHDDNDDHDHHGEHHHHRDPASPVKWYRPKLSREQLSSLNRKSDVKGLAQTLGYLGTLAATGTFAVWSVWHLPWYAAVLAFWLHGTCYAFLINGFHELVHESVFRTRWLNGFFLRILSFLGWHNHHAFWASHTEHHKFTLHPPDDLEVVLPFKDLWPHFRRYAIVNWRWPWDAVKNHVKSARGIVEGEWMLHLYPPDQPEKRRGRTRWSRIVLVGHGAIAVAAVATGYWPVLLAVTFAPAYGGWLQWLCNNTQHTGLRDNVPDFRLCCRTLYLNPAVRFLYWHMNYHTEHHMYAGVPCYNLGKLHELIKHELPESPRGLIAAWRQIAAIAKRQRAEPAYQFEPPLPAGAPAAKLA